MTHDTASAAPPQSPTSTYLTATATPDGNVIGVWSDAQGDLWLTYVNDDDSPGLIFDLDSIDAITEVLNAARSRIELTLRTEG